MCFPKGDKILLNILNEKFKVRKTTQILLKTATLAQVIPLPKGRDVNMLVLIMYSYSYNVSLSYTHIVSFCHNLCNVTF